MQHLEPANSRAQSGGAALLQRSRGELMGLIETILQPKGSLAGTVYS